jgi:hypothetical protein
VSPVLVAAVVIMVSARVSMAQPVPEDPGPGGPPATQDPVPTTRPQSPITDPLDPDDLNMTDDERETMEELLNGGTPVNPCRPRDGTTPGNTAVIVPDDCWGDFPTSRYDIGCDEGAWNHVTRKVYCALTDLTYQGATSSTANGLRIIEWAYTFEVWDRLGGTALAVNESYQTNLILPIGLSHVAWFYTVVWAGVNILRGRAPRAAGELGLSLVMAALAALLLANPAGYFNGAFDTTRAVSGALLSSGTGEPPPDDAVDAQQVLAPLQGQIHELFVAEPYNQLNWGTEASEVPQRCELMLDRIVLFGPHGSSDGPRRAIDQAGCGDLAEFNARPTPARLYGAFITAAVAMLLMVLLGLVSLTIVIAQFVLLVLFAAAPFAALGAVLAGGGRNLALGWLAAVIRVMLAVIGMSLMLSLMLLSIEGVLSASTGTDLYERFTIVLVLVAAMFIVRRRVLAGGARMASSITGKLAPAAGGGGDGGAEWLAGAVGGVTGFAIAASGDAPGRARKLATGAAGTRMARQRSHRAALETEARSLRPVARESTEISVDEAGRRIEKRSVSISGAAPMTRRARLARDRLERRTAAKVERETRAANSLRRRGLIPRPRRRGEEDGPAPGGGGGS